MMESPKAKLPVLQAPRLPDREAVLASKDNGDALYRAYQAAVDQYRLAVLLERGDDVVQRQQ